jgi:hypothetical protein
MVRKMRKILRNDEIENNSDSIIEIDKLKPKL